jgi:alpha-methylacyl-CoA racemase
LNQRVQPLAGRLVVDLTRYLPGPYASRELLRLGARVVRVEPPDGDPMRKIAPAWDAALNAGKESVVCDLRADAALANALCARADIVLESFRPGVLQRLGIEVPEKALLCSITGFGGEGRHAARAGHDLNYLGWAGTLADTAPALPPVQVADLAAGALAAVVEILAALIAGTGGHIVASMTHGAHRLVAHRLGGDPVPRLLTGGAPCYAIYTTADGRWLTVAALETKFWSRLCELLERPDLLERQYEPETFEQLSSVFGERPLDAWLERFEHEDVCVGPVLTLDEAAAEFGHRTPGEAAPRIGEHTDAWRRELQLTP